MVQPNTIDLALAPTPLAVANHRAQPTAQRALAMETVEGLIFAEEHVSDEEIWQHIAGNPLVLKERNRDGRTILQHLVATKRVELVERLGGASADWDIGVANADEAGWTALHQVASLGLTSLLPIVLPAGVNARTQGGQTALHYAASKGHAALAEALLRLPEAEPAAADRRGQTPLHRAAALGRTDIVTLLLARDPSMIDRRDGEGNTALYSIRRGLIRGRMLTRRLVGILRRRRSARPPWRPCSSMAPTGTFSTMRAIRRPSPVPIGHSSRDPPDAHMGVDHSST